MLEEINMEIEPYEDIQTEIERVQNGYISFDVRIHEGRIDEITFREHAEWQGEVIIYEHIEQSAVLNH